MRPWRLLLSEEMTVTLPVQIAGVYRFALVWIFIPLWSSNAAWCAPDRSLNKNIYVLPLVEQVVAWIGAHGKDPLLLPLYNDTCSVHSALTCSPSPLGEAWEWTSKGFNSECAETQIIQYRMSGEKSQYLDSLLRCDRRPHRKLLKTLEFVWLVIWKFVNFHTAEFSQTKPMR